MTFRAQAKCTRRDTTWYTDTIIGLSVSLQDQSSIGPRMHRYKSRRQIPVHQISISIPSLGLRGQPLSDCMSPTTANSHRSCLRGAAVRIWRLCSDRVLSPVRRDTCCAQHFRYLLLAACNGVRPDSLTLVCTDTCANQGPGPLEVVSLTDGPLGVFPPYLVAITGFSAQHLWILCLSTNTH